MTCLVEGYIQLPEKLLFYFVSVPLFIV